jgi:hypothetical protein
MGNPIPDSTFSSSPYTGGLNLYVQPISLAQPVLRKNNYCVTHYHNYITWKTHYLFDNVDILSDNRAPDQAVVEEKEMPVLLHPSICFLC